MCTVLLPPGDNPIAVNKYISHQNRRRRRKEEEEEEEKKKKKK
jgi:hypothetical protein